MQRSQSQKSKAGNKSGAAQRSSSGSTVSRAPVQRSPRFAQNQNDTPGIPLMGGAAQTKVDVGAAGDPFEREADAVSNKVKSGEAVQPSSISSLTSGAINRMTGDEKKPPTEAGGQTQKPVQKQAAGAKPDEKKPESKAVQKAGASGPTQKPEEKKPDSKPVQKAGTPAPAQKPEEKKPESKPVQKAEATKPEQKPEEKKPESKAVQKAETPGPTQKPEEKKPESKAVQKAETPAPTQKPEEKKPESKAVQKAEAAKEPPVEVAADSDEMPIQASHIQREGKGGAASMSNVAESAISSKGPGRPMNPDTRGALESRMGSDFSDVRVHDDSAAQDAASGLDARAFTHQNDVWLGRGESDSDVGLMAHEATHVIQQSSGVQRQTIQRANGKGGGKGKGGKEDGGATITGEKMEIPAITLPKVADKDKVPIPLKIPRTFVRSTDQRDIWKKQTNVDTAVDKKLPDKAAIESKKSNKKLFYLKLSARESFLVGDKESLKERLRLPNWTKAGFNYPFDVDHIRELQLGGDNNIGNMQLLDFSANRSAGTKIENEVDNRIREGVRPHVGPGKQWKKMPDPKAVRKKFDITFNKLEGDMKLAGDAVNRRWKKDDVEKGEHLKALDVLTPAQVKKYGLLVDENELKIFTTVGAGKPLKVDWDPKSDSKELKDKDWEGVKGFTLKRVMYSPGPGGKASLEGTLYKKNKHILEKDFSVALEEDAPYILRMSLSSLKSQVASLRAHALSPIEIYDVEMGDSLVVRGVLKPTLPLLPEGTTIDITVEGEKVILSKTFSATEISFPKPIDITEASLTISIGDGLEVKGDVLFEIERVGKGKVSGIGSTKEGFGIEGEFAFDSKLFQPAEIKAWYKKDSFGMSGKIGITEGKVRGIKSATVEATYEKGKLDAKGKADLSVPGIKSAAMNLSYSEEEGLAVGGSFELANNIPGIKSGGGEAQVKQKKDGEGYEVFAKGTAVPNLPGVTSSINITYENGAITIEGTVAYEKGMLKGSVTVGVTNRPVDDSGVPGAGPGGKDLKVYGGGTVTIKIAPWLQGTVGIKLLPNGEVVITGEVGLPSSLDIFPEKKFDKNIFKIGIDIPIVGVAVAGQRIGIFANISGGLDLSAGIGPGQIQELGLKVTYNPSHEEQTVVTGRGKLHIPAHAGLRLFVRGGLGVGIPIVSAQAGLEIGGQLGLEGAIDAGVEVNWTPTAGLKIDAFGEVYVEPKLKFDVSGFVNVEADLLITTITLYEKKWQLASFEWGSGLRFGVKFPIHYEEGKPFNVSLDDLQFQVPDINPTELLSGLIDKIA